MTRHVSLTVALTVALTTALVLSAPSAWATDPPLAWTTPVEARVISWAGSGARARPQKTLTRPVLSRSVAINF